MDIFRPFLILTASLLLLQPLPAASPERFDATLRAHVANGDVAGVVGLVVGPDTTLYTGAFGKADTAHNRAMMPDAIFRIASMTKPITSLAVMMLVEQGQFGLDDEVGKYLPAFANARVATAWHDGNKRFESRPPRGPITIRNLLTHTSGIAYSFVDARLAAIDDGHKGPAELPLLSDPGERFAYGPSTAVLGDIIARISHQPLDAFFASRIFEPLGMHETFFLVPDAKRDRVVTVHARTANGTLREDPNPATLLAPARGDGGLFSTAADYARFMQLFLNRGRVGTTRLVTERTIDLMTSNQLGALTLTEQPSASPVFARPFPIGAGKDGFGFGFQIEAPPAAAGLRSAGSLSWGGIFNTHFWIDPKRSIAAVVMMQTLPYYDARVLTVLRDFEHQVYAPR